MHTFMQTFRIYLHLLFLAALFMTPAIAQVDRTSVNGTVMDPAGRALPDVRVVAIEESTGWRRETITSGAGTYDIPELPVGIYVLEFTRAEFQPLHFADVIQEAGKTRTLNATLQVGTARTEINVSASKQVLELGIELQPHMQVAVTFGLDRLNRPGHCHAVLDDR